MTARELITLMAFWMAFVFFNWTPTVHSFVTDPAISIRRRTESRSVLQSKQTSEAQQEEEARLKILQARRQQIRDTLKSAEKLKYFRLANGLVPEMDENGEPIRNSKAAVSLTAFVVAAGVITLRVGGRAALVSATGLDMIADTSPEIKENLDTFLTTAEAMDGLEKSLLFTAAWTAVKVFCFDAGGVVLALASGILFGGVIQGAFASAGAATFGSLVCYTLSKYTILRKKALEILEEYPSLRGIEKVVARDGFKAVLTLRLAPVLPIPLGMYNYIYGVTNVPVLEFVSGVFLGSLKPYLLDSYLGYFGKEVLQGSSDNTAGLQDFVLLGVLGVSVLIGVFASQLASETWDSVLQEIEDEKKQNVEEGEEEPDDVTREMFGIQLPEWMVGFQYAMKDADQRVNELVEIEYNARVWNYTTPEEIPLSQNPSGFPESPEILQQNEGIDLTASLCDGLILSPILWSRFSKYSDPLFVEDGEEAREEACIDATDDTEQKQLVMLKQIRRAKKATELQVAELGNELKRITKDKT